MTLRNVLCVPPANLASMLVLRDAQRRRQASLPFQDDDEVEANPPVDCRLNADPYCKHLDFKQFNLSIFVKETMQQSH
jgi:hypothetical protein